MYEAGDTSGPPSAPGRAIAAGHIGVFDLREIGAAGSHVFVVTSNRPVAVGIDLTGPAGAATSAAVPDFA